MSQVNRICPQCGGSVSLQSRYCGACGYDTSAGLPAQRSNLPAQVGKAALPVVAGLAGLVLRTGWKVLQNHLTQMANNPAPPETKPLVRRKEEPLATEPRRRSRTIRIRSAWAIGDAHGIWRQGQEEHIIEIED